MINLINLLDPLDLLVIGAGPAGCGIAIRCARAGMSVLVVDRGAPGAKPCGGCLDRPALDELAALHVDLPDARPLTESEILIAGRAARLPIHGSRVISRTALDASLRRAAERAGAVIRAGTSAQIIDSESDAHVAALLRRGRSAETLRVPLVVIAAGVTDRSTLPRGAVPASDALRPSPRSRVGLATTYDPAESADRTGAPFSDLSPGRVRMCVAPHGYVGFVRVHGEGPTSRANAPVHVAAAIDPALIRSAGGAGRAIRSVLSASGMTDTAALDWAAGAAWQGTGPLTVRRRCAGGHRTFIVGDAAGYVEPFTGEGIGWALTGAAALAPILVDAAQRGWSPEHLERWSEAQRGQRRRMRACRVVAWTLRRPALASSLLRLGAWQPRLRDQVMNILGRGPSHARPGDLDHRGVPA